MRPSIVLLLGLALVAGCDRQSADAPQPGGEAQGDAPATLPPGEDVAYQGQEMGRVVTDHRGMAAPDIAVSLPDGAQRRIADFGGTPVLVNLWATWCAPCIAELPTLDALAERSGDTLKVMTISQDLQGAEAVTPFMAERGFRHLEPWLDPENRIMMDLELESLPVTILYGSDGAELFRVYGGMDWNGERAIALIDEALGK